MVPLWLFEKKWFVALLTLLGVGVIAFAGYLFYSRYIALPVEEISPPQTLEEVGELTKNKPLPEPSTERLISVFPAEEHVRGNPEAPITIIEYADFEDAYSGLMHQAMKEVLTKNADTVNWVFRHFPLSSNALALPAAESAECAHEQGGNDAFWTYADALYEQGFLSRGDLSSLAEDVGLDSGRLRECLESGKFNVPVRIQKRDGFLVEVDAVPAFFFKNNQTGEERFVLGVNTVEYMQRVIDDMKS